MSSSVVVYESLLVEELMNSQLRCESWITSSARTLRSGRKRKTSVERYRRSIMDIGTG